MDKYYYDASEVKIAACHRLRELVSDIYPDAKIKGAEARLGSINGEPGSSMSISLDPLKFAAFYDHASDDKGDLITILEHKKGLSYAEAIEWLGDNYSSCIKREFEPKNRKKPEVVVEINDFVALSDEVIEYCKQHRSISKNTLDTYKVQTWANDVNVACFLSVNRWNQITKIEYWNTIEKKIWSSKNCQHNLFGKNVCTPEKLNGELIICEGRWDAMSYHEAGLPAVSIPSGVTNNQWIDEDWEYLQQFHTIYLSYDMDEAGQNAIQEIVSRLGVHKCKIISLPEKDASDVLTIHGKAALYDCSKSATVPPMSSMVASSDLREETYELMLNGVANSGDEYFMPDFDIKIRPHEMTLVFGLSFHGKSQFVSNQIAFDASNQIQSAIASFEQITVMTMTSIVKQYSNNPYIANDREAFDDMYDSLCPFVTIYDTYERTNPQKIIDDFTYAHKRKGINRFYVDNVMSLGTNRDDNAAQASTAHLFREFTKKYPVHLFVVAHPRKPPSEASEHPPKQSDIRGAGEWGDIPENIITVWRNIKKHEDLEEMKTDKRADFEINNFDRQIPDGKILVRKQRATGTTPMKNFWFHNETQRFSMEPGKPLGFTETKTEDPF